MQIPFRAISKFAVKTTVGAVTASAIETTITTHTELDEDDIIVTVSSGVGGFVVSSALESRTDALVDKTADKLVRIRTRKNKTETTESL